MNAMARRAISTYSSVGLETGIHAADPHKLILMLFEGAVLALTDARAHMAQGSIAAKGASMSKAIAIIVDGLKASLNVTPGNDLSARLADLYDYMVARLLAANMQNDVEIVDEVTGLLGELRGAWEQIRPVAQQPGYSTPVTAAVRTA